MPYSSKVNRHMVPKTSLKAFIDEMETLTDQRHAYLNTHTGAIVSISDEEMEMAETGEPLDALPDWQRELVDLARTIVRSGNYLELPYKYDMNDYAIIERFCQSQADVELRGTLLDLIRGSGAFGRFKHALHEFGIAQPWYHFRRAAYREIALEWLESNHIPFIDDDSDRSQGTLAA